MVCLYKGKKQVHLRRGYKTKTGGSIMQTPIVTLLEVMDDMEYAVQNNNDGRMTAMLWLRLGDALDMEDVTGLQAVRSDLEQVVFGCQLAKVASASPRYKELFEKLELALNNYMK